MRILVISDTHIPVAAKDLPEVIKQEAKRSDYCFHAGDFVSLSVFEKISNLTKVYGVSGNMDSEEVRHKLPEKLTVNLGGIKFALIHGRGAPSQLIYYINKTFLLDKKRCMIQSSLEEGLLVLQQQYILLVII